MITYVVPDKLARAIPGHLLVKRLGAPGIADVFITAADDIQGMTASQIAETLAIPYSATGFNVIGFNTPAFGLASPVNRTDPNFVGRGRTAGGVREFVLPDQPIPEDASTELIK